MDVRLRLGEFVQLHRKRLGISQIELAERAGISNQTVSRLERNEQTPDFDTLFAIAGALGVSMSQFARAFNAERGLLPDNGNDVEDGELDVSHYEKNGLPVFSEGDAHPDGIVWDGQTLPAEHIEERISRPYDLRDRAAYGVKVRGDSMVPIVRNGMKVIVSPNRPWRDGDFCFVQLRSGERLLKLVRKADGGGLLLESANPTYPARFVARDGVLAIHTVEYVKLR